MKPLGVRDTTPTEFDPAKEASRLLSKGIEALVCGDAATAMNHFWMAKQYLPKNGDITLLGHVARVSHHLELAAEILVASARPAIRRRQQIPVYVPH